MDKEKKTLIKLLITIFAGVIVTTVFLGGLIVSLLTLQREILSSLVLVSYASIIVFLVLLNKLQSKRIYLILLIPVICFAAGIGTAHYQYNIDKIPKVEEYDIHLWKYMPFDSFDALASLDEESTLKFTDNFPVLDGATALFPVYSSFVQAVYPKDSINPDSAFLLCSKTEGAYANLFDGKADIIFCASPSQSQLDYINSRNINVKFVPIGREAFVFFVNNENPVNDVSVENIRGIYSGKIRNWKELGGFNQRIRAFQRQQNSGSQTMFIKMMEGSRIIKPGRENVYKDMLSIVNRTASYRDFPNAIGYSFLFYVSKMAANEEIKLLSINGVHPSAQTIQDNSYPFADNFYAIYLDNEDRNKNIDAFIEWILSEQGQTLIQKTGYVPIN